MFTPTFPRRSDVDACPGALRLHAAADGPLARVRLPGGLLTGAQLTTLRELAERWGDGHVELTSRANLQLRALTDAPPAELADGLRAAGLLPSPTHELVRNIAASPIPTREARAVVTDLDRRLCADPQLAELPGRFLFALDDGTGDVAGPADVAAFPAGGATAVLFAGRDQGLRVPPAEAVTALLAGAHAFLEERATTGESPWRVGELADGPRRVAAHTAARLRVALGPAELSVPTATREWAGAVAQPDGSVAVAALVPLGRLDTAAMAVLERADQLVVTPGRGVVVADLPPSASSSWLSALASAGLEVTAGSRWSGVTACAGRPGCGKALADVRRDASTAVELGLPAGNGLAVHWVGCARGCGSPGGDHVRVEATGDGYAVTGPGFSGHGPASEVAALVAAARRS